MDILAFLENGIFSLKKISAFVEQVSEDGME